MNLEPVFRVIEERDGLYHVERMVRTSPHWLERIFLNAGPGPVWRACDELGGVGQGRLVYHVRHYFNLPDAQRACERFKEGPKVHQA